MNIVFKDGSIRQTDYFSSADCSRGHVWLVPDGREWHLLLPRLPKSFHVAQAYPLQAEDEPAGWQWCVDVDGEEFPVSIARIVGNRPEAPAGGHYLERRCVLYTGYTASAGHMAFGAAHGLQGGLQSQAQVLWLTNGIRVGYKPRQPTPTWSP